MSRKIARPQNHPHQVARRGVGETLFPTVDKTDEIDTRLTSDALWRRLDAEFHFTIDVAASAANTKCERFYDRESDGLAQSWAGEVVWCNPPYSDLLSWVRKASAEILATTVLLLPANRTDQPFWQDYIEPARDGFGRIETRFLRGRQGFSDGDGKRAGNAPFASVVVIFRLADTREGPDNE